MKKGILLIALGHQNYYRMAVVLAASIKVNDGLPVCLVTDAMPSGKETALFDSITIIPEDYITQNGQLEYIRAKLFMYDLSPFNETIFLDVDQVLLSNKNISTVFDELKNVNITFSNTGVAGVSIWADIGEVKKLYGDKPYWNFHSELVYFKKCKQAKKYFDAAKKVYSDNKIKSAERFAGATMADELAFQVAAIVTDIYPHKENWTPNAWFGRDKSLLRKYPYELKGFITYSIGGNTLPKQVKDNYNILAKHYFAKLNLVNPYQAVDKRYFVPGRKIV